LHDADWASIAVSILITLIAAGGASAQPRTDQKPPPIQQPPAQPTTPQDKYLMGLESRLEIVVHVMGEVERPGEYRVTDDTDVLELISKAGGPTRFANMSGIRLRRIEPAGTLQQAGAESLVEIDLSAFLKNQNEPAPPLLYPGDVVTVPRNKMAKWSTAFVLVRDIAVVVSTYLIYLNIVED
jgi:hypothetical protein